MNTYPSRNQKRLLCAAIAALFPYLSAHAEEGVFELGTVRVVASDADSTPDKETRVDNKKIERFNRNTVGEAAALVPGMSMSRNSRNEEIVYLRGFDVRQVPLFIDGIPAYVPYDGYVDFGRFKTFDIAEMRVATGSASLLYGPNTLGGAINLVTRKPSRTFEGDVKLGAGSGNASDFAANLGSNLGKWYMQVGASYSSADNYPLSDSYHVRSIPTSSSNSTQNTLQGSGDRENAYREDWKASLKLGLTPNATDEYAVGYISQHGSKGNPPYAGDASGQYLSIGGGANSRFWQWPYWNMESLYSIANVALGDKHQLKARVYTTDYTNSIRAYTNDSYSTQLANTSNFPSWYDDNTTGYSLELASYAIKNHELSVAYHEKTDRHEDRSLTTSKLYRDVTESLAFEDRTKISNALRLRVGASHERREAKEVYQWAPGKANANNWLTELTHPLDEKRDLYLSASRKTRFPTIKDRYSASLGSGIPNPDLRPEHALHYETGFRGEVWDGGTAKAALFQSQIKDLMQRVNIIPVNTCGGSATSCTQLQNMGRARHRGVELSLDQNLSHGVQLGASYTYLQRQNLTNNGVPLTDTPRNRIFSYASWAFAEARTVQTTVERENGRWVAIGSGNSAGYTPLPGPTLVGVKTTWQPSKSVSVDLGVSNLTDDDYELADGYPMPGRMWFANLTYRF